MEFKYLTKEVIPDHPGKHTGEAQCPNCNTELKKKPGRKKECPHCSNPIYVRTHYLFRKKILLTEQQKEKYEKEKKRHFSLEKYLETLQAFVRINNKTMKRLVDREFTQLKRQFEQTPALHDLVWRVSNTALEIIMKKDMNRSDKLLLLSDVNRKMAMFLHNEGKSSQHIQRQSKLYELKSFMTSTPIKNKIAIEPKDDSCKECKMMKEKTYPLKEILNNPPLPCVRCSNKENVEAPDGWCRCKYAWEIDVNSLT